MRKNEMRQVRSLEQRFETREDESGDMFISGYFAVFKSNYEIWDGATESIDESAFDDTLKNDIRALANHDTRIVLGRTSAGTLSLRIDERGLWGDIKINPADSEAVNLYERVKRGDVDQCSIGFNILEEDYSENVVEGTIHWTIKKIELFEVSVVTFPAYEATSVQARERDLSTIKQRDLGAWKNKMLSRLKGE